MRKIKRREKGTVYRPNIKILKVKSGSDIPSVIELGGFRYILDHRSDQNGRQLQEKQKRGNNGGAPR
jgi:hypothetical protein